MSDMGFGYYGTPDGEGAPNVPESAAVPPKWYRDKMEADSKVMQEMRAELDQLRKQSQQAEVAKVFQAQGFDPGAAALYSGDPSKAEEWLQANGSYLSRSGGQPPKEQVPAGPPTSTVPADSQAGIAAMNAAGADGSAQQLTGDDAIAAALAATRTPEEFQQVARAHGWNWDILA